MKTIAVIEDDVLLNEALSRMLAGAGYQILRAHTLREGLDLIPQLPDLMIIDINLPDGEGTEACRQADSSVTVSAGASPSSSAASRCGRPLHRAARSSISFMSALSPLFRSTYSSVSVISLWLINSSALFELHLYI